MANEREARHRGRTSPPIERHRLFGCSQRSLRHWTKLLALQVDVSFALELPTFYASQRWHRAKSVIDVGTGTGAFLRRLAPVFPTKQYMAIDRNRSFLRVARRGHTGSKIGFAERDVFEERSVYDYAILRAFIRQVPDSKRLLRKMAAVVSPQGGLVVIDFDDEEGLVLWPPLPVMDDLYLKLSLLGGAPTLRAFLRDVRSDRSWRIVSNRTVLVPSTIKTNRDLLTRQFHELFEVLSFADLNPILAKQINVASASWKEWCSIRQRYLHIPLRIVELSRTASG